MPRNRQEMVTYIRENVESLLDLIINDKIRDLIDFRDLEWEPTEGIDEPEYSISARGGNIIITRQLDRENSHIDLSKYDDADLSKIVDEIKSDIGDTDEECDDE